MCYSVTSKCEDNIISVRIFSLLNGFLVQCPRWRSMHTQAQASAIVEADVVKSAEMQQHSMFQTKQVLVKGAEVRAAR